VHDDFVDDQDRLAGWAGQNGQPAAAAYTRDAGGIYRPYGICVLTVTGSGIRRISSFGDPRLVAVFGF
jgi:RNA polymerase sigma-70 factor, ECF subfamily